LLGITLPACLGFAVISAHVANVILGADFRELAGETMPVIAVAVVFQILTQQYLHASFLLSERNSFYLINTASIILANIVLSYILVSHYGTAGAAWARLGDRYRRLRLRAGAEPLCLPRSAAARPAGADGDRRPRHGARGRGVGPSPARRRSRRLHRAGRRRLRDLCGPVLAVRHLAHPRPPATRPCGVPNPICKQQYWIEPMTDVFALDHTDRGLAGPAAASASQHPQSLLELPPGEARQSLLTVHSILEATLPGGEFDL
jgi:hypothetical protein